MHASRNSSAARRSTRVRAMTIPPTHVAAIDRAVVDQALRSLTTLRSRALTIAWNTAWNARRASSPLRATSVGRATIGQESSKSSRCCHERWARTTCGPTSLDLRSTGTPSQQLFQSGSTIETLSNPRRLKRLRALSTILFSTAAPCPAAYGMEPTRRQAIAGVAAAVGALASGARRALATAVDEISRTEESVHQEVTFKAGRKRVFACGPKPSGSRWSSSRARR